MNIKVCDPCVLEGRLNAKVKFRYGLRSLKGSPVHLCAEHRGLQFSTPQEQLDMMLQVERQVKLIAA